MKILQNVFFALTLFTTISLARAQQDSAPVTVPFHNLEVSGTGVKTIGRNYGEYSCGTVNSLHFPQVEHTFLLRNVGDSPIVIDHLEPTCGCSSPQEDSNNPTSALAPGKTLSVRFILQTATLLPGGFGKYIYVFIRGDGIPAACLGMVGEIQSVITFDPHSISFGAVTAGQSKTLLLHAQIDKALIQNGIPPPLRSSNPDIKIIPVESPMKGKFTEDVQRSYEITLLKHAQLGRVGGYLCFTAGDSRQPLPEMAPEAMAGAAIAGQVVYLTGMVKGKLSAYPPVIIFGSLKQGMQEKITASIHAVDPTLIHGLRITSSSPYVMAVLAHSGNADSTLHVTITGKAPAGGLAESVTVLSSDGERLVIKIYGSILKNAGIHGSE